MRTRGLALIGALSLLGAAPAAGRVLEVVSVDDPVGDGNPDITRVRIGSNPKAVTFIVDLAGKTDLAGEEAIAVFVDSDLNSATGLEGFEYGLRLTGDGVGLGKWDGTQFVSAPSQTVYGYSYNGFRLAVDRSDLALTGPTLRFVVLTFPAASSDAALAEYELSNAALQLQVASFKAAKSVGAGKRFSTSAQVRRSDLAELTSVVDNIVCTAKVGAKAVKVSPTFSAAGATCSGVVPKAAKGKTLKVTTAVTLDGARVTRTASIKVK